MFLNQGKLDFSKMRDIIELRKVGIDLSTSSDEVAKLWDAISFQTLGFFDSPELDGIQGSVYKISNIDPDCPLIKTMQFDIGDANFEDSLLKLKKDLRVQNSADVNLDRKWTQFEKNQIQSFIYRLEGYDDLAEECCFRQLAKYPLDMMTFKSAIPLFILNGSSEKIATLAGYSSRALTKSSIFYPFVRGYEAFGLEERGHLDVALKIAKESIDICSWNTWGVHSVAHIYDAMGRADEGLDFMIRTREDWAPCTWLCCHNNWHIGLFHLDNFNFTEALNVFDTELLPQLTSQFSYFKMTDSVSLLTRIEMEQRSITNNNKEYDISSRWNDLFNVIIKSTDLVTGAAFHDAHLALAMMGSRQPHLLEQIRDRTKDWLMNYENRIFEDWELSSFKDLYSNGTLKSNRFITSSRATLPLINAMIFANQGDYQSAANVLFPVRNQLIHFGGSNTQRDVFIQFLSTVLLMAGGDDNVSLLRALLFERHGQRAQDDYCDRTLRKIIDFH